MTTENSAPISKPLRVVIGVGGGIAAYKAAHLVRFFTEGGHDVHVIPTESALNFVGAATFEALSGHPVTTTVFDYVDSVHHVRLGQEADLIVIAPTTADLLARLAQGRADDLLTATCLVATCPVVLAPAMHTEMWHHPATVDNVATLRRRGTIVLDPAHGRLTGADTGPGRLPEPEHIGELALTAVSAPRAFRRNLAGTRVLITAGGTHEAIDPVRFIGNSSSGRQGFALADIAAQRGATVTLIAGSTENLPTPSGARVLRVRSAQEMHERVMAEARRHDIIIMAAAVADFRPAVEAASKMKKEGAARLNHIELVENPDILAGLVTARAEGVLDEGTVIIGFAAETGDDEHSPVNFAQRKLRRKGCDGLMCNEVGKDKVFGQAHSSGWFLRPASGGEDDDAEAEVVEIAEGSKHAVAAEIWDEIVEILAQRNV